MDLEKAIPTDTQNSIPEKYQALWNKYEEENGQQTEEAKKIP